MGRWVELRKFSPAAPLSAPVLTVARGGQDQFAGRRTRPAPWKELYGVMEWRAAYTVVQTEASLCGCAGVGVALRRALACGEILRMLVAA
jgi:hypothetical protein